MKKNVSNIKSTYNALMLLLVSFLVGISTLVILHLYFLSIIEKLDWKVINLESKIRIGEFIAEDIHKIRSDFFELSATTSNKRGRELIQKRILERIEVIESSLQILKNGGTLERVIKLNIAGHHNTVKIVKYIKQNKEVISLEVIDVMPKLIELKNKIEENIDLLEKQQQYLRMGDLENYASVSREIHFFNKSVPAYFTRMLENVRRLLYEGEIEFKELQAQINDEKNYYSQLELAIVIFVAFIVLLLGFIIAKQILKSSKNLESLNDALQDKMQHIDQQRQYIRSILDAQPNIVLLTNGEILIDANYRLFEFLSHYNDLDEFKQEHTCICELFEPYSSEYLIEKDYDGKTWIDVVLQNKEIKHKVAIKNSFGKLVHFSVDAVEATLENGEYLIIVSFNDISREVAAQLELKHLNDNLEQRVEAKTKQLQELNENLEQRVIIEVQKNRKKDQQMIQQSRFAALGEMIGNIAHQWRQPLSAINSTASGMKVQLELNLADMKDIDKSYNKIMEYVSFLNQTIEDFREFFKEDKESSIFSVNDVIKKAVSITSATYKDNMIELTLDLEEKIFSTTGFPNELSQVFLNILNNARDALIQNKIQDKKVYVRTYNLNEEICIEFYDNGLGIKEEIIDKIFDPYFTTKHQSQGTGIGLYMSKEIVEKHMNGKISVQNVHKDFNDTEYNGAMFKVILPRA